MIEAYSALSALDVFVEVVMYEPARALSRVADFSMLGSWHVERT